MGYAATKSRRIYRVRRKLRRYNTTRPRLSVFRSARHIYAQLIDDVQGQTLCAASSLEKENKTKAGASIATAQEVGKRLAERAQKLKQVSVVFDRGGYLYHGRVKALAEAARQAGLKF